MKALVAGVRQHGTSKHMRARREFLAVRGLAQRGNLAVQDWHSDTFRETWALEFLARLGDNVAATPYRRPHRGSRHGHPDARRPPGGRRPSALIRRCPRRPGSAPSRRPWRRLSFALTSRATWPPLSSPRSDAAPAARSTTDARNLAATAPMGSSEAPDPFTRTLAEHQPSVAASSCAKSDGDVCPGASRATGQQRLRCIT